MRETRQVEKEFKSLKDAALNTVFKRVTPITSCLPQNLVKFAKQHLTQGNDTPEMPEELKNLPQYILDLKKVGNYHQINQKAPDLQELKETLSKLKNNKAASDIPAEFLKYATSNEEYLQNLIVMFQKIWDGHKIPKSWGLGKIETLYKNKGSRKEASNYRLLTIGSSIGKIFRMLLVNRLNNW